MAQLELTLDPSTMVCQAAIFLTNIYIVKKLMLDPYLKLKDHRDSLTVGSQSDASEMLRSIASKQQKVDASIAEALSKARDIRLASKEKASGESKDLMVKAKSEAESELVQLRKNLADSVEEQRSLAPQVIESLVKQIYKAVV